MHRHVKTILFVLFLWPVSVGELSVNYSFALFAVASLLWTNKIFRPNQWVILAIIIFSLIFILSAPFHLLQGGDQLLRACISFSIFMTVFAFSMSRITPKDIDSFRLALVLISCLFAGKSLVGFIAAGGNTAGWDLKDIVGSQRFGFIYILGFFVAIHFPAKTQFLKVAKLSAIFLILAGIFLTFSRSAIVSLIFAIGLYSLPIVLNRKNWSLRGARNAAAAALIGLSTITAVYMVMPVAFEFFNERILIRFGPSLFSSEIFASSDSPVDDLTDPETSEGTRLAIREAVLQHNLEKPILGSGYLGSWVLEGVTTGSAHNQYLDIFLRVGFLGFVVWIFILYRVFRFLLHHHPGLFWGGGGVLIYGLFHETFKESQGAFVLAFLVGMWANHVRAPMRSLYILRAKSDPEPVVRAQAQPIITPSMSTTTNL